MYTHAYILNCYCANFYIDVIYYVFMLTLAISFLKGAYGGKIIVLQTMMPNVGVGALKQREDPSMLGTLKVPKHK